MSVRNPWTVLVLRSVEPLLSQPGLHIGEGRRMDLGLTALKVKILEHKLEADFSHSVSGLTV